MNSKVASMLAALALTATPLVGHTATGPTAALDACVKAFVDTYLPGHPVKKTRVASTPTPLEYWQREYQIGLKATGLRSGVVLAQALCVANNKGIVLVLDNAPRPEQLAHADFIATL